MATHTLNPSPSRRHVLAALSGAAFAGSTLVLAIPGEAPAAAPGDPHPDADLIRICEQHIINVEACNAGTAMESLDYDIDEDPLRLAYEEAPDDRSYHSMEEHWASNLVCDLLRLADAGRVAA